jgi:hypothetical protein
MFNLKYLEIMKNYRFMVELAQVCGACRACHAVLQGSQYDMNAVKRAVIDCQNRFCDYLDGIEEDKGEFEGIDTEISLSVSDGLNCAVHACRDNDSDLLSELLEEIDVTIFDYIESNL